jgi:CHAD domain-containing protein
MLVDQEHCRTVFKKLSRELTNVTKRSTPDTVHMFRTSTRRVETVVEELVSDPDRSTRKLLKMLRRLRKRAGKVRDLDVQIASLRNLQVAREAGQKSQLLRALAAQRIKKERKLAGILDQDAVSELRKRLKRACSNLEISPGVEPLSLALRKLSALAQDHSPLTPAKVHQYRIAGKRARYLIEIAGSDPQAEAMIGSLKKMQNVAGDWHDWLTLTESAEKLFGGVKESALVAAMRNLTRAKFRESVAAVMEIRSVLPGEGIDLKLGGQGARKQPLKMPQTTTAAA